MSVVDIYSLEYRFNRKENLLQFDAAAVNVNEGVTSLLTMQTAVAREKRQQCVTKISEYNLRLT